LGKGHPNEKISDCRTNSYTPVGAAWAFLLKYGCRNRDVDSEFSIWCGDLWGVIFYYLASINGYERFLGRKAQ
jgi:hypothetical protein